MNLVYFSKTKNIERFILKLDQKYFKQIPGSALLKLNEPIILFTYTTGLGQVPKEVMTFCENNNIRYVIASGNRNWGKLFANSANLISTNYGADILYKFELSGTNKDLENVRNILKQLYNDNLEDYEKCDKLE